MGNDDITIQEPSLADKVHAIIPAADREIVDAIIELLSTALTDAENAMIDKAHQPCECGREHFGTPVRSVQGNVTTYCQFSRVELQSKKGEK